MWEQVQAHLERHGLGQRVAPREALLRCGEALSLQQEIGDRFGEASTHDSIGYAHRHLGDHDLAVACFRRAIALHRQLGERHQEADPLKLG